MNHLTAAWARTSAKTFMGKPVMVAEIDASDLTTTRCVVAYIEMPPDSDGDVLLFPLSVLTWDRGTRRVELAFTTTTARRQGLARACLEVALKIEPRLRLSDDRTSEGDAWSRAVALDYGLDVPPKKTNGQGTSGLLLAHLGGYTTSDLIGEPVPAT